MPIGTNDLDVEIRNGTSSGRSWIFGKKNKQLHRHSFDDLDSFQMFNKNVTKTVHNW